MKHRPSIAVVFAVGALAFGPRPILASGTHAAAVEDDLAGRTSAEAPTVTSLPDHTLRKMIGRLRQTPIGIEATAAAYLDLIETGRASAAQVNDFATYLAKRGMPKIAGGFQEYAVHLSPNDATLWLNLGTIRRSSGSLDGAAAAYKHSISLDAGNALAYYNLGSVYDAQKNYDAALEQYGRALVLQPDLADPKKNPQVVNNDNLLAVKLRIYQNQAGSMGLPLLQMQKQAVKPKAPEPEPEPEPKPEER